MQLTAPATMNAMVAPVLMPCSIRPGTRAGAAGATVETGCRPDQGTHQLTLALWTLPDSGPGASPIGPPCPDLLDMDGGFLPIDIRALEREALPEDKAVTMLFSIKQAAQPTNDVERRCRGSSRRFRMRRIARWAR